MNKKGTKVTASKPASKPTRPAVRARSKGKGLTVRSKRPKPSEPPLEAKQSEGQLNPKPLENQELIGIGSLVFPRLPPDSKEPTLEALGGPPQPASREELSNQILELEARLDELIRTSPRSSEHSPEHDFATFPDLASFESDNAEGPFSAPSVQGDGSGASLTPVAHAQVVTGTHAVPMRTQRLSENPYFQRYWGEAPSPDGREQVDDFGYDPQLEEKLGTFLDFINRWYFRVKVTGAENIPSSGRAIIVANHSGTLPFDGLVLRTAVARLQTSARKLRWLTEDFLNYLPFVGVLFNRLGAVRACQENAERLLMRDELLAVFPEGVKGIRKLYQKRYTLERFGRGGFVRLALRTRSPLIPCAIIGAEESNPMLKRLDRLPRLIGLPYLPVTPTFPWLGPLGLLPWPTRWSIYFGEPFYFDGYGPEAVNDSVLVSRLSDQVQRAIEDLIARGLSERKSIWLG